jgi:hypothetical protein
MIKNNILYFTDTVKYTRIYYQNVIKYESVPNPQTEAAS